MLKKVGLVGLLAAAAFALPASAATVDELQAQVNALLAQLAGLQGGSSSSAGCYTFTMDLSEGSTGADVTALQNYLASTGHFSVAATGYFGPITRASVASWQAANGVAPAAGYFGAISRAKYNSMCGSTSGSTGSTGSTGLGGGEADLSDLSFSGGDDSTVGEGQDGDVAELEFDVDDADVELQRVDLVFKSTGTDGDTKPWKVFEDITLFMDGDDVADVDGSDSDNWDELEDDEYRIRFSGINEVLEADETAMFVVNVALQNSVKDSDGDVSWTLWVADDGIRALDGEGIDHTIGDADALVDATDEVEFDIDEEGADEELEFQRSSDDPDATTFLVDEDDKSDWFEVFIFDIAAEDNDVDLENLTLTVTVDDSSTTTEAYNKVVDDIRVVIDGKTIKLDDVENATGTTATTTFDIDGKVTVDADDEVQAVVEVRFRPTAEGVNYTSGTTRIEVATAEIEGEGSVDLSDDTVITSAEHTLSTSPATVSNVSWSSSESANGSTGILDFFFTVTADEDDVDVLGSEILDVITGSGTFEAGTGSTSSSTYGTLSRVSGDSVTTISGGFRVNEGDTTRFRVRYNASGTGEYEVSMTSVAGQAIADDDQLSPTLLLE